MKIILKYFLIMLGLLSNVSAENVSDIQHLRNEFNIAITNKENANKLYFQLSALKPAKNTLQYAYLGATEALLAKHAINPFSKLSYVNSAMRKLNMAVELNKNDIEIRYMRFSVESNMPAYLGYNEHIEVDKNILITGLSNIYIDKFNCKMYQVFATGLLNSNYCNLHEKSLLYVIISRCQKAQLN